VVFFAVRFVAFLATRRFAGLRAVVFFAVRFVAFLAVRRLAGFRAVVFFTVRRLAGLRAVVFFAVRLVALRAGARLAVFLAVLRFAGGTVTTFRVDYLGCSTRSGEPERRLLHGLGFTADLNLAPTVNFTPLEAAICTGSPVRGLRPTRA